MVNLTITLVFIKCFRIILGLTSAMPVCNPRGVREGGGGAAKGEASGGYRAGDASQSEPPGGLQLALWKRQGHASVTLRLLLPEQLLPRRRVLPLVPLLPFPPLHLPLLPLPQPLPPLFLPCNLPFPLPSSRFLPCPRLLRCRSSRSLFRRSASAASARRLRAPSRPAPTRPRPPPGAPRPAAAPRSRA